jgi:cytochrome c-type biogenesis protein CcmH
MKLEAFYAEMPGATGLRGMFLRLIRAAHPLRLCRTERRRVRTMAMAMTILVLSIPAQAVLPDEMLKDPALEIRARQLSEGLRCMVCQNESIDESEAPLARDLRILIRERIASGDTDAEVKDFVVARYGDYVLLKPRLTAQTLILWFTPFLIVAAGLLFFMRRKAPLEASVESPLSDAERRQLDEIR